MIQLRLYFLKAPFQKKLNEQRTLIIKKTQKVTYEN